MHIRPLVKKSPTPPPARIIVASGRCLTYIGEIIRSSGSTLAMRDFGFPIETIVIFVTVIALSVWLDLLAHRRSKEISVRDAALWSVFWVSLAMAFYVYLWLRFDKDWADMFLAGYVLEESLSIDNLMVFMAIFANFGITGILQHRILYYGILGALVFRAIFVGIGTALFAIGPWVGFVFAGIVAWTAWKMMTAEGVGSPIRDYSDHWSVKMTQRIMPIFPRLHLDKFFLTKPIVEELRRIDPAMKVIKDAPFYATPAFLCLMAIETSDVMFAFDSVPAVIAVTQEPLLVYASCIFAVLGLRSLYFVLAALTQYLVYLEKAVIALLWFIAAKLALQASTHMIGWPDFHIGPTTSLAIVLGTLAVGVLASLIFPQKKEVEVQEEVAE